MDSKETQDTAKGRNRQAFRDALPALLEAHRGKYGLVYDGKVIDTFDSMDSAYREAVKRFGLADIWIGHITDRPDVQSLPALVHGLIHARP